MVKSASIKIVLENVYSRYGEGGEYCPYFMTGEQKNGKIRAVRKRLKIIYLKYEVTFKVCLLTSLSHFLYLTVVILKLIPI